MMTILVIQIIVRALILMELFLVIVTATTSNMELQAALGMGKVNVVIRLSVHC